MSFVQIWIHAVWGTKNHQPLLLKPVREQLYLHIKENAKGKGYYIDCISGYFEHVHALFTLKADLSIAKQIQLIKGESSFWLNRSKLIKGYFEWANEYFAISVGKDKLKIVRDYINGQEQHHRKITFAEEYNKFLKHFDLN